MFVQNHSAEPDERVHANADPSAQQWELAMRVRRGDGSREQAFSVVLVLNGWYMMTLRLSVIDHFVVQVTVLTIPLCPP